jgi:hypothetical protein
MAGKKAARNENVWGRGDPRRRRRVRSHVRKAALRSFAWVLLLVPGVWILLYLLGSMT